MRKAFVAGIVLAAHTGAMYVGEALPLDVQIAMIEASSRWNAPAAMRYAVPADMSESDFDDFLPDDMLYGLERSLSSSSDSDDGGFEDVVFSPRGTAAKLESTNVTYDTDIVYVDAGGRSDLWAPYYRPDIDAALVLLFVLILMMLGVACVWTIAESKSGDSAPPASGAAGEPRRDYFDGRRPSPQMGQMRGVYPAPPASPPPGEHAHGRWRDEPLIFEMPGEKVSSPQSAP